MKTLAYVSLFLLCSSALTAQSVIFTKKSLLKGVVIEQLDTLGLLLDVTMEGSDEVFLTNKGLERKRATFTVLEVDESDVRKYKYQVHEAWEFGKRPGSGKTDLPIHDKTYLIERRNDSTIVLLEDGSEPTSAERAAIIKESGKSADNALVELLNGRSMQVGETLQLEAELLASFRGFMGNDDLTLNNMSLTLKEIRTVQNMNCAVFDLKLGFSGNKTDVELDAALVGEAIVAVESLWPISIVLSGKVQGVTIQQGMSLLLNGTMSAAITSTYSLP